MENNNESSAPYEVLEDGIIIYDGSLQDPTVAPDETAASESSESETVENETLESETLENETAESIPVDSPGTESGGDVSNSYTTIVDFSSIELDLYSAEDGSLAFTSNPEAVESDVDIQVLASTPGLSVPEHGVYKLEVVINNVNYTAVFPNSARESLIVVDGLLFNVSQSNISGRLYSGSSWSSGEYPSDFVTLVPINATNSANTVYRNGNYNYHTHYSPGGSGSSLSSTNYYTDIQVPGYKIGYFNSTYVFYAFLVLMFAILISAIRRKVHNV